MQNEACELYKGVVKEKTFNIDYCGSVTLDMDKRFVVSYKSNAPITKFYYIIIDYNKCYLIYF